MCHTVSSHTGKRAELYYKDDPDWVPSVGMTGQQQESSLQPEKTGTSRYQRRLNRAQRGQKNTFPHVPSSKQL